MKVTPPQSPPAPASPDAPRIPAQTVANVLDSANLKPGQTAVAQVLQTLANADGESGGSRLLLAVQGQSITVDANVELQPGQLIKVERAGNQLRLMEIISPETPGNADRIAQALVQRLPFQHRLDSGLRQLLQSLASLTVGAEGEAEVPPSTPKNSADIPGKDMPRPSLETAIRKLIDQMPTQAKLSQLADQPNGAETIKQLLRNSGAFSEAHLASLIGQGRAATLPPDFKLMLTEIMTRLAETPTPPGEGGVAAKPSFSQASISDDLVQAPLRFPLLLSPLPRDAGNAEQSQKADAGALLKLVAGMLNRIAVTQLHAQSLNTQNAPDNPAQQTWLVEIPWLAGPADPRTAQLRLERRERDEEEGGREKQRRRMIQWHLNLALELDGLGPVYFEVALRESKLDAHIWAEKDHAVRVIRRESDGLRQRFTDLGLQVAHLECHRGQPRQAKTQLAQRLVDIKA